MDSKLDFFDHLNHVINKANKQLGFIKRHSKDFKNKETLRLLYMSLVRPIICYNSTIWYPIHKETMTRLERIQHKFFKFASSQLKIHRNCFDHDYNEISKILNIPSIESVFRVYDLVYIYKMFNNFIDCNELCSSYIKEPNHNHNTRNPNIFDLPYLSSTELKRSPMYRPQKLANDFRNKIEFQGLLPKTFANHAKKLLFTYE